MKSTHQQRRLARFDGGRTGVLVPTETGDRLVDLAAALAALHGDFPTLSQTFVSGPIASWVPLIERWEAGRNEIDSVVDRIADRALAAAVLDPAEVSLEPPLPDPVRRIFALAGNFFQHVGAAEEAMYGERRDSTSLDQRRENGPWGFSVLPGTVVGPEDEVGPPPEGCTKLDYEGEVAVVVGVSGRNLSPEDVAIWGYTAWNDISVRDSFFNLGAPFDRGPMAWTLSKNFDGGNSAGPWLLVDHENDVADLNIALRVNGELRQQGNTSDMIFDFAETVSHLSRFMTIRAGDVVLSGTPAGTAMESGVDGPFLEPGDQVEVDVDGIDTLRNTVAKNWS